MSSKDSRPGVVHIVRSLEVGGLERLVCDLAIESIHFRPIVVCLTQIGTLGESLQLQGFPVVLIGMEGGPFRTILRLRSVLKMQKANIVHCHNLLSHLYGSISARLCGISTIVFSKHGTHFPLSSWTGHFNRWMLRYSHIIAVSKEIEALCIEQVHPRKSFLHYIPNGLSLRPYNNLPSKKEARSRIQASPADYLVGVVARLAFGKGHLDLLRGFSLFAQNVPNTKLIIIGDGPNRSAIEELTIELKLQDRVKLLGTRTDIPALLSALDVFILTSENEGIPMTILEAMAARLPVIATNVGGIPQVVVDGETGVLIPLKDPEAIANAFNYLYQSPEIAQQMGNRGRQRLEEKFDSRRMVEKYEELYFKLLEEGK